MADGQDALEGPFAGLAAYRERTPLTSLSRAAQLGILGQLAVGSREQADDLREDAAALRVPQRLSEVTRGSGEAIVRGNAEAYLRDHVPQALDARESEPATQIRAVREAVEDDPGQWSTLALAWVSMRSRSPVERAMGAAVVASYTLDPVLEQNAPADRLPLIWESGAPQAFGVLRASMQSRNPITSQVAAARLGIRTEADTDSATQSSVVKTARGDSITVQGTWSRISEESWHRPGDATHSHIRGSCTPGLYAEPDFFRWSGAYSPIERAQASTDLATWPQTREIALDTAHGHSHGGNVLLDVKLEQPGELLLLMHTPVLPRADEAWARIRATWHRVLAMRSRADPVVIADGLRTGSTGEPDRSKLPFGLIRPHIKDRRGWFTHGLFVQQSAWVRYRLSNEVSYERRAPSSLERVATPSGSSVVW